MTWTLLSGCGFQAEPSCTQRIELATSASLPSGVMARLVGGPKIEFISGRSTTIFGLSGSVPMSMIETVSWPGADATTFPASSQITFWSLALSMSSAAVPGCPASSRPSPPTITVSRMT